MLCGSSTPVLPLLLPALCFGNLIFQMGRLAFCWALPQKSQGGQRARRATPSPLLASGAWLPRWGLALARTSPPPAAPPWLPPFRAAQWGGCAGHPSSRLDSLGGRAFPQVPNTCLKSPSPFLLCSALSILWQPVALIKSSLKYLEGADQKTITKNN